MSLIKRFYESIQPDLEREDAYRIRKQEEEWFYWNQLNQEESNWYEYAEATQFTLEDGQILEPTKY